jgi:hypothetical protein
MPSLIDQSQTGPAPTAYGEYGGFDRAPEVAAGAALQELRLHCEVLPLFGQFAWRDPIARFRMQPTRIGRSLGLPAQQEQPVPTT